MIRLVLFYITGGSILAFAGFFPTPSSESYPEFLRKEVFALESISSPDQPTFLGELNEFVTRLPNFGKSEDTDVASAPPARPAIDVPELPTPAEALAVPTVDKQPRAEAKMVASIVNFDLDAVALDDVAVRELDDMVRFLAAHPSATIGIYGHADLTGPEAYNDTLAQDRADKVAGYLVDKGIGVDRIALIKSYGETAPVVITKQESRENRRVRIATMQSL